MQHKILIVDDDPLIRRQLEDLYRERKYEVASVGNAEDALSLLADSEYSLAIVDLKIPGTDGISLTKQVRERWPDLDVIIVTGYASIKGAVEAIRHGASDYITKPFEREEILLATEKVLEKRRLLDEISYLRNQLSERYSFANMVSRDPTMHEIFSTIEALACGLPVVAFDTGALPELVSSEAGRITPYGGDPWRLEPPDIDGLARAAMDVLSDQERFRGGARQRAEQAFSLDSMVDGYLQALLDG